MAAELASGYVTLTVKLAKDGMAEVTKEVKKAGQEGGTAYSDEFNKQIEKDVGKKIPDTIGKATKDTGSGGIKKAAKEAAEEFGQGFIKGVEQAITGGITSGNLSLEPINEKVRQTTDLIKQIGGATGIDTSGIDSIGNKITSVLGNVETQANKVTGSFRDLNSHIDELGRKGEGGKLENLAGKVGLVADAINTVNDIKATSEDWNQWAEDHISWYKWMNQYTPDKIGQMARERADAFLQSIGLQDKPVDAFPKLESGPPGPPVTGPNPLTAPLGIPGGNPPGRPPAFIPKPTQGGVVGGGAAGPVGPTTQGAFIGGGGSGVSAAVAPAAVSTPIASPGQAKQIVHATFGAAGASPADLANLDSIIGRESHPAYSVTSTNPTTGDYGIFQFNPSAGKGTVSGTLAEYLGGYTTDAQVQANAGLQYILDRYGHGQGISAALQNALEHKDAFHWYDEGGVLPPGKHWVINATGEPELVLNADQAAAAGMDPNTPPAEQSSARTPGFTPVSNTGGVPGTSTISKFLQLGNEAVGGVIDLGAQAAKMGISAAAGAGSLGAGAAAGPAAGIGIDIASSIAKRGVSYGFQMAGIGADALIENIFSPFGGAPRWLGYDYTKFAPSMDPLKTRASSALGDAIKNSQGTPHHQGGGGPTAPGPVDPQQLPGQQGVGQPTPGLGQKPTNQDDWFSMFGFDDGGWFPANSMGVNTTGRPEAILSPEQWETMSTASPGGGYGYGTNIEHLHVSDVEAMGRELDKRGRLNMMRYSGRP